MIATESMNDDIGHRARSFGGEPEHHLSGDMIQAMSTAKHCEKHCKILGEEEQRWGVVIKGWENVIRRIPMGFPDS